MAADRGLSGHAELREALREDDKRLATSIMTTLESKAARTALLRLEGLSAQNAIDVIQDVAFPFEFFGRGLNRDNRF